MTGVRLQTDKRFYAGVVTLLIKLDGSVRVAVVGHRDGARAGLFGLFDQFFDTRITVQQAVLGVIVQMNEFRHPLCSSLVYFLASSIMRRIR